MTKFKGISGTPWHIEALRRKQKDEFGRRYTCVYYIDDRCCYLPEKKTKTCDGLDCKHYRKRTITDTNRKAIASLLPKEKNSKSVQAKTKPKRKSKKPKLNWKGEEFKPIRVTINPCPSEYIKKSGNEPNLEIKQRNNFSEFESSKSTLREKLDQTDNALILAILKNELFQGREGYHIILEEAKRRGLI